MGISLLKDGNAKFHVAKEFTATGDVAGSASAPFNVRAENQLRIAVENVDTTNEIVVKGRIAKQASWIDLETITGQSDGVTVDISLIDEVYFTCSTYDPDGSPKIVASGFFEKAASGGGSGEANTASNVGTSGVGIFSTKVGVDLKLRKIDAGSSKVTVTLDGGSNTVDIDVDPSQIDVADLAGVGSLNNTQVLGTDGSGNIETMTGWNRTNEGGVSVSQEVDPLPGGFNLMSDNLQLTASGDASANGVTVRNISLDLDYSSSGELLGNSTLLNSYVNHDGTADTGAIFFKNDSFNLGNGTDPVTVNGIGYYFMGGAIEANATLSGYIQGCIFQPSFNAAAILDSSAYITAFADGANIPLTVHGYTSANFAPTISGSANNTGVTGVNLNPTITTMVGNSGYTGVAIAGTIGTVNSGFVSGLNFNQTVTLNKGNVVGLNISMDNVTNYAGVQASVTIQDLTFTFVEPSANNNVYQIRFVDTVTAGSETVSVAGNDITVAIESGVSTATQVKAAADATIGFGASVTTTISGVASNPQVAQGFTSFAGGENPGVRRAAQFDGDVTINGSLGFSGALSIGALSAFMTEALIDGGGTPSSGHSLITAPTVAANATLANADYLGVNTASLINIGANATVTTAFLGVAALGLPAVLTMGAGATLDRVSGAIFALSLDASAGGGTVDQVSLCRAAALPNGITTVNRMYGYEVFSLGAVGTTEWGFYCAPAMHNYLGGTLRIGGTTLSDDTADTGFKLHVDGNSKLEGDIAHLTGDVGFFGTTPVGQQTGGAATAGGTYGATEQSMLQAAYDALRAYGLLT